MLAVEKEAFDKIMQGLNGCDKKIEKQLKDLDDTTEEDKTKMVVFVQDTDEFLDLEGNKLGPFKKGDFVNISQEIANILIVDKKAEIAAEED